MNKYSSKAIKTAATVGMSLAMVLSNAAPVLATTAVTAPSSFCITDKVTAGIGLANAIDTLLANAGYTKETVKTATTFTKAEQDKAGLGSFVTTADDKSIDDILNYSVTAFKAGSVDVNVATILAELVSCNPSANEYEVEIATHFVRKYDSLWKSFDDLVGQVNTVFGELENKMTSGTVGTTDNYTVINDKNYTVATALNKKLAVLANYVGNVDTTVAGYSHYKAFKTALSDYEKTLEGSTIKSYINQLETTTVAGGVDVRNLVDKNEALHYRYLTTVENFIKNVKNNKIATLADIAKYSLVKDADEVVDYINGLEEIVTEMKAAKALLDDSNDAKKAYDEVSSKIADLKKEVVARKALGSDATQNAINTADDNIQAAMNKFTKADLEAVQTYVEDVVNEFVTVKARKLSSGTYSLSFENASYGRYISQTDNRGAEFDTDLTYLMLTTVEKNSDGSYYDLLIDTDTSTKDTLLKAVTSDIDGITLGSTLTDKEAAKIVAAKKAYDELDLDGTNPYALTAKEKRTVKANKTLIDTLYQKLIWSGVVTTTGWVDKGNGNWDYIAEDGSRPTKWIASGSNWYYVKNGTMLRNSWIASDAQGTRWYYVDDNGVMVSNTTVNGYTFNSYGVWVK